MSIKPLNTADKLSLIYDFFDDVKEVLSDYSFINCTTSPIPEYVYIKQNGLYYRNIENFENPIIHEANYFDNYKQEGLFNRGISLKEYVDMNILFELEKILIVSKTCNEIENLTPVITLLVCPDGIDELHISGQNILLAKLIELLNVEQNDFGQKTRRNLYRQSQMQKRLNKMDVDPGTLRRVQNESTLVLQFDDLLRTSHKMHRK